MPLKSGKAAKTKAGKEFNFRAELEAGKPRKQALAIMYAKAGESKGAKAKAKRKGKRKH